MEPLPIYLTHQQTFLFFFVWFVLLFRSSVWARYSSQSSDGKVIRYIRNADISEDGYLNEEKVPAKDFSENYALKGNDFLIARSGNTVEKAFLYKSNIEKAIYAGRLFRMIPNSSSLLKTFLVCIFVTYF